MSDLKDKKLLIIVESPNKCTAITNILKKAGYKNVNVVASYGHIMKLADGGSYYNSGVEPTKNFELMLQLADGKNELVRKLKAQAWLADAIYLCSDDDREGALIAWSLIKFLGLEGLAYYRAVMHEITPKAVIHAIEHPVELSNEMIEAALARLTIDKMIGYTLSPVAKAYVGARSVGRCQSAGLKLIVDREKEIRTFEPEEYYDLYLSFKKQGITYKAKYVGTTESSVDKIKTTEQLEDILFECTDKYKIKNIQINQRKESTKAPFCTATFQQEAATKLGLRVKDAMSYAQRLFEGVLIDGEHKGLITYMRTDSTSLAEEFIPELKNYITNSFGANFYRAPKTGKINNTAQEGHEALRVVDPALTPDKLAKHLKNDSQLLRVYKLIWQRTIASALPEAVTAETCYTVCNNNHLFKFTSKKLISAGYKMVYEKQEEPDPMEDIFEIGELLENTQLNEQLMQTSPPARYKEASLVKELQQREIGRPSTYATIVDTVLSPTRGYCTLEDRVIIPTERGIQLAGFLDRSFSKIISLDYTKQLEESLDKIAAGELNKLEFLNTFYAQLEQAIADNKETMGHALQKESKICPKCGAATVIRRSRFGKLFHGCSNYPKCTGIINI